LYIISLIFIFIFIKLISKNKKTIVVGDKSLVDVVAHEISHSWTGNLVTNSNWVNYKK